MAWNLGENTVCLLSRLLTFVLSYETYYLQPTACIGCSVEFRKDVGGPGTGLGLAGGALTGLYKLGTVDVKSLANKIGQKLTEFAAEDLVP